VPDPARRSGARPVVIGATLGSLTGALPCIGPVPPWARNGYGSSPSGPPWSRWTTWTRRGVVRPPWRAGRAHRAGRPGRAQPGAGGVERMPLLRFIIYTTVGQPTRPGRPRLCGPVADQTRGRPSWPAAESPASSSPGRPGTGEEACGGCGLTARRHSPLVGTRPRWLLHAVSGTGCRWLVLAATLVTPRARRVRLHPRRATSPATGLALAAGTGSRAARGGRRPPAPPSHR
jgi:hypothetical protein